MSSIRDWTNKTFNKLTDWFSFGVLACWLFTGIHPFRGKHDYYDKKYKDSIEKAKQRVIDGISIFNNNVRVAPNAKMNNVPKHYKNWFIELFEKCKRLLPPMTAGSVVSIPLSVKTITGTNNFIIKAYKTFDNDIIWYTKINGIEVTKTTKYIDFKREKIDADPGTNIVFSPKYQIPLIVEIKNGFINLSSPDGKIFDNYQPPKATELMVVKNTLYYRTYDKLIEMKMTEHRTTNTPLRCLASYIL